MHALKAAGWHAVTLDQLQAYWTRGAKLPAGKPIVLTFDNGYHSQYAAALPVLRELGWVADENLEEWTDQFSRGCVRDWMTLWDLLKPVVAQVHGNCLAGGLELMSMADIVFVADDARLGYPPMRGLSTPDTAVFAWKLSMAQAKYIQLTGNSISGRQAAEWGWVAKSFPADQLESEVARELHVLRNIDPSILAANKMAVNQAYELMGMRTHVEQSWVWHHLSNQARARSASSDRGGRGGDTIRDSLAWMNQAADEVGLL
jgi:enoyl-CoA hydratase